MEKGSSLQRKITAKQVFAQISFRVLTQVIPSLTRPASNMPLLSEHTTAACVDLSFTS